MCTCSSRCRRPRAGALALAAVTAAASACAQESSTDSAQRVVVTGSQIARIDAETALPVQILRREDIERSGATNVEEIIGHISATMNNPVQAQTTGNSKTPGFSGASLRGLGTQDTLVLLNGRRLSNYAFGEDGAPIGVDLHAVPLAAIDRIEVLTDGASAIYGSDAVAGVINFILRRDYRGGQATLEHQQPLAGGGNRNRETLTLGAGVPAAQGYNVLLVVDHQRDEALAARRRSFASNGYLPEIGLDGTSPFVWPANVFVDGVGLVNPLSPDCPAQSVRVKGECHFDAASQSQIVPQSDTLGMLLRGGIELGHDGQAYAEWTWSRQRIVDDLSASPVNFFNLDEDVVIKPGSPFHADIPGLNGDIVDPLYRSLPLGPRIDVTESVNARLLVGWQGRLGAWDVDTAVMQSVSRARDVFVSGEVDLQAVADAIAAGQVNAFGDSGAAGDAVLAATQLKGTARRSRASQQSVDARASRDLLALPGGPATLGLGAAARHESLSDEPTDLSRRAAGGAFAFPKGGSRDVESVFAELLMPVLHGLDVQTAVRIDRYGDFGTTTHPKLALRWQPASALMVRASGSTGFRAPSLSELYTPRGVSFGDAGGNADPLRCKVTHLDGDCDLLANFLLGGTPTLRPEKSRQTTLGLVFKPAEGSLASLDWWHLRIDHTITTLPDGVILSGDPRFENSNIVRGPVQAAWPTLPGPIVELKEYNENVGRTSSSGLDVVLHYRAPDRPWGRLTLDLHGSYLAEQRTDFGVVNAAAPVRTDGSHFARWQHVMTLDWELGDWGVTALQTWHAGRTDAQLVDGQPRRIAAYKPWNLQTRWTGVRGWTLTAGVNNLFDVHPPRSNQNLFPEAGYDPADADPRGRTLVLRASVDWH